MAKMNILSQILFALLSISLFLSSSAAAPRGIHARHLPSLAKRAPPEIENWPLYRTWADLIADPELGVPAVPNVEVGTVEGNTVIYVGETGDCEKRATRIGKAISALYTAVFRGELVTIKQDGTQSTEEVAIKRARGNSGDLVLYGGTVQKQFSDNDNILPVIDYFVAANYKYIVMPWVGGGSLDQKFGAFSAPDAVNGAFKQILNAVSALHSAGYMHRDLKPENLLNDSGTLKLMDFDHTTQQSSSNEFGLGTPTYAAPEIIAMKMPSGGDGYNKQIDVFSLGVTYLVMSESSLQNSDDRFLLWKELVEPDGKLWPSADQVAKILAGRKYETFSGNDNLLQVIAKALCSPTQRYADAGAFQSAFDGAV